MDTADDKLIPARVLGHELHLNPTTKPIQDANDIALIINILVRRFFRYPFIAVDAIHDEILLESTQFFAVNLIRDILFDDVGPLGVEVVVSVSVRHQARTLGPAAKRQPPGGSQYPHPDSPSLR